MNRGCGIRTQGKSRSPGLVFSRAEISPDPIGNQSGTGAAFDQTLLETPEANGTAIDTPLRRYQIMRSAPTNARADNPGHDLGVAKVLREWTRGLPVNRRPGV